MQSRLQRALNLIRTKLTGHYPGYPVLKPIDTCGVEILADPDFQASCREVSPYTVLDTPRLANLWQLCRMTDPVGNIIEVGSYRGGGALHLSNCCPGRKIFVCDSFEGFQRLDPKLDQNFRMDMFKNTSFDAVNRLFMDRHRRYEVLAGFFPISSAGVDIAPISFVHLDVDLYEGTRDSLEFLHPKMTARSLMVLDDCRRKASGVDRAVAEFVEKHPDWTALPLFPGQALLLGKSWFGAA